MLSHLFNDAVDLEIIGRSPCRAIKLPKLSHGVKRVIGPDDPHCLADEVGPEWRLLIYLGGVMGSASAKPSVSAGPTSTSRNAPSRSLEKTRSSLRTLVFPTPLVDELTAHLDRSGGENPVGLVFHDSIGGPVRASNLGHRVLDPAVRSVGLDGLTFPGLRHSAATEWVASGIDARTVQHRLGHTDPSLRLYAHSSTDADRQAADVVGHRFWPPAGLD